MTLEELQALGYEIEVRPTTAVVYYAPKMQARDNINMFWIADMFDYLQLNPKLPTHEFIFSIEISGQRHRSVKRPMGRPVTREIAVQECIRAAKLHYVKRRLSV